MAQTIEAVYEKGVFKPLQPVQMSEGQQVILSVEVGKRRLTADEMAALAQKVYAGLSEEEIAEVESIALDRSNFMRQPTVHR